MSKEKKKRSRSHEREKKRREILDRKEMRKKLFEEGRPTLKDYVKKRVGEMRKDELKQFKSMGQLAEKIEEEVKADSEEKEKSRVEKRMIEGRFRSQKNKGKNPEVVQKLNMITRPREKVKRSVDMEKKIREEKEVIDQITSIFGKDKKEALEIFKESRKNQKSIAEVIKEREGKNV